MSKVKRFSLEERYGYQNRKVIYDKNSDNDIELNNIYPIIDLFNQLDEQILDLQHKLKVAEKALELACERVKYFEEMQDSEMGFEDFFGYESNYDLQGIIEQYNDTYKLEKLLNQQDREINRLTKMLYTTTKHADKLNEENNKLNKIIKANIISADKVVKENQQLKQQLAEKDKEIENNKKSMNIAIKFYSDEFVEKDKELKELRYNVGKTHQDKISFAVEQLEKVKEHFINIKTPTLGVIRRSEMVMYIDNQIKELKGDEVV